MLRILKYLSVLVLFGVVAGGLTAFLVFQHYAAELPEVTELANYDPPRVTRVHAGDGRLLAEFSIENRVYVPIEAIPLHVREAFISAEDKSLSCASCSSGHRFASGFLQTPPHGGALAFR